MSPGNRARNPASTFYLLHPDSEFLFALLEKPKDPGIPNNFPYKDQILAEIAEERRQVRLFFFHCHLRFYWLDH
jgi:GNL3L/Grn1 putative GTPase